MNQTHQEETFHVVHPDRRWGITVEDMSVSLSISDLGVLLDGIKYHSSVCAITWISGQTIRDEDRLDGLWPEKTLTITLVK